MRILLAASEAVPFCKTGGLADVVGALAPELAAAGHEVRLVLPKYRAVGDPGPAAGKAVALEIPLGAETLKVQWRSLSWKGLAVDFVDYPPYYDREGLYGALGRDHPDNDRRFVLFSRAALEGAKARGFKPDLVHAHDWQAALIPAYLKGPYAADPFFAGTASMLTIHNMAYQGNFPASSLSVSGFPSGWFTSDKLEYYGQLSCLKAGLVFADLLTTVSPTYAREIQESSERGFGLEGLLRSRGADLHGVLNGIDLEIWNPETDRHLPRTYGAQDFAQGKAACRELLQKEYGLAGRPRLPLVAIISRLDHQKGLDLAMAALEPRLGRCRLAVLGTGDPALRDAWAALARRRPGSVHFHEGFDEPFAHRLYAAADIFLMPSRFEPCGLGHMIAMRYGAVPVASRTGGLADTVFEVSGGDRLANGFLAAPGDAADLGRALDRALAAWASPGWSKTALAGMRGDYSWGRSVRRYLELYELARRRAAAARS